MTTSKVQYKLAFYDSTVHPRTALAIMDIDREDIQAIEENLDVNSLIVVNDVQYLSNANMETVPVCEPLKQTITFWLGVEKAS